MENNKPIKTDPLLSRTPPYDVDAEAVILGSAFVFEGVFESIRKILKTEDFYKGAHKKIFSAMTDCANGDKPLDPTIVCDELNRRGELESVGGPAQIMSLMEEFPVTSTVDPHLEIILRCSVKRTAIDNSSKIIEAALEDKTSLDEFMAELDDQISEVRKEAARGEKSKGLDISLGDLLTGERSSAIETPFQSLNELITGFNSSELIILGGKSGMGKTAFCLDQLRKTALEDERGVMYYAAQMDEKRIFLRLIAQMCQIDLRKLLAGRFPEEKRKEIMEVHKKIASSSFIRQKIIKDRISLPNLQRGVEAMKNEFDSPPGLLIIENLQQIYWPGRDFKGNTFAEANFMIEKIKPWAQGLPFATIISSQLNRKVAERDNKRPEPTDIFGKDAEELAEVILLLFRPDAYEKKKFQKGGDPRRIENNAEIIIGKGGPPVTIPMSFVGSSMLWTEREED